jgi:hypothetical protein
MVKSQPSCICCCARGRAHSDSPHRQKTDQRAGDGVEGRHQRFARDQAGRNGNLIFTNTPDPTTNNFWRIRSVP